MSKYYYIIIGIMISTLSHMILNTNDPFFSKGSLVSVIIASILWVVVLGEEGKK